MSERKNMFKPALHTGLVVVLLLVNGCKTKEDSPTGAKSDTAAAFYDDQNQYPASKEQSGIFCELAVEKDTLSTQDTLVIKYSMVNNTGSDKTYKLDDVAFNGMQFSLKTEEGRLIMKSPAGYGPTFTVTAGFSSKATLFGYKKIQDDSGSPIVPGVYLLRARLAHPDFPTLMLSITIK